MRDPALNAKLVINGIESPMDVSDLSPVSKFEFFRYKCYLYFRKKYWPDLQNFKWHVVKRATTRYKRY